MNASLTKNNLAAARRTQRRRRARENSHSDTTAQRRQEMDRVCEYFSSPRRLAAARVNLREPLWGRRLLRGARGTGASRALTIRYPLSAIRFFQTAVSATLILCDTRAYSDTEITTCRDTSRSSVGSTSASVGHR
jgi:hypothetical protein